jgi:two-component system cell cycle response regulator
MAADTRRELSLLLSLLQRLSDGRSLEEQLAAVTDAAIELVKGDHASIRLLDASRTLLLSGARSGKGTDRGSLALKKGDGIAGWVLEHAIPARVDDATKDSRFLVAVGQGFRIGSMIAEPLMSGGKAIGVLSISSPDIGIFTDDHVLLARLLANASVPAIERGRMERLAVTDELTLTFREKYLVPRLREEIERARSTGGQVSVLAIDLDRFKHVNASYGQTVGDRLLALYAERVRAQTRPFDVLVRTGGDEFALVMPSTDSREAARIAERLHDDTHGAPIEPMAGGFISQTASMGIATFDGAETAEALIERTKAALERAKGEGGDRIRG